jgi:methyltransferase (TIGR00027 family)
MKPGQFSRTALGAAGHRAAHQVLEGGRIFADPLALRILGEDAESAVAEAREDPRRSGLRNFIATRSRFAEEAARQGIGEGARQIVVLGAGLDTFAYRLEPSEGLRVFEVDHPATQAEKRRRLAAAGIAAPAHLTFAPCDFEREALGEALRAVGFDPAMRAFFIWLGVVPYLTEAAIFATLGLIAGLPAGEVAFDYGNPAETIADPAMREYHKAMAERVADAGEAFQSYFETPALHEKLRALGFQEIEDLGPNEIAARFFPELARPGRANGGHVVRAGRDRRSDG